MRPTHEEILARFVTRLTCYYKAQQRDESSPSVIAPHASTLPNFMSSSTKVAPGIESGIASDYGRPPRGGSLTSTSSSSLPRCSFPCLSLSKRRRRRAHTRCLDEESSTTSMASAASSSCVSISSSISSSTAQSARSMPRLEDEENMSMRRLLARPMRVDSRGGLTLVPSALLRNLLRSFGRTLEDCMHGAFEREVRNPLVDAMTSSASSSKLLEYLSARAANGASPVRPVSAEIYFHTISSDDALDPLEDWLLHGRTSSFDSSSDCSASLASGSTSPMGRIPREVSVPLEFEATVDVSIVGEERVITVSMRAPGTIMGGFVTKRNRLDWVKVELDTKVLGKCMKRECMSIVKSVTGLGDDDTSRGGESVSVASQEISPSQSRSKQNEYAKKKELLMSPEEEFGPTTPENLWKKCFNQLPPEYSTPTVKQPHSPSSVYNPSPTVNSPKRPTATTPPIRSTSPPLRSLKNTDAAHSRSSSDLSEMTAATTLSSCSASPWSQTSSGKEVKNAIEYSGYLPKVPIFEERESVGALYEEDEEDEDLPKSMKSLKSSKSVSVKSLKPVSSKSLNQDISSIPPQNVSPADESSQQEQLPKRKGKKLRVGRGVKIVKSLAKSFLIRK